MWSTVGCLVTLTLSLLAAPLTAMAQPRGTLPLVGVLEPGLAAAAVRKPTVSRIASP
jgi:hypothetical protein